MQHTPQTAEFIDELQTITDYVSGKARLLAEECNALLEKHVVYQKVPQLPPLLSCVFHSLAGEDSPIQGIIVSHGRSTASSIASIANQLTGGYYFKAFDMPNTTSTRDIIDLLIIGAITHLLAIFVPMVTPALIVGTALQLSAETTAYLVSMAMIASGIGTWLQVNRYGMVGSGLLSIQSVNFSFVTVMIALGSGMKNDGFHEELKFTRAVEKRRASEGHAERGAQPGA